VVTLAALDFEGVLFLGAELVDHFGGDGGSFKERGAHFGVGTFAYEKHFLESEFVVDGYIELFNVDGVSFLDAVLFAAGFEYCVRHRKMMGRGLQIGHRRAGNSA
jgi:hypothetical protein